MMRFTIYTILLLLLVMGQIAIGLLGLPWYWIVAIGALIFIDIILLYRSVSKPLNAVKNGIYLLREQDFGSRLRLTRHPDADRVVNLFNKLMDTMKAERLKTLEQNKFLSHLVEASPMGIAVCDYDGNIVDTNRAWNTMMSPALNEAIDSVAEDETQTVRLADSLIVRISRLWFMESGFRRQFILVERLTAEIVAAEKQLFNKIVRTIGHEVNNTLGSVISVLDTLADMNADDRLVHDTIAGSTASCDNLVKFVKGYADLVKLPEPKPEAVDLNEWITLLHPTLATIAPANVTVEFIPDASMQQANIDPMLMERVIVNIVKNAVESIGDSPDGRVTIHAANRCITVTDNGRGITADAAAKLFTPFFSTKRPDRGLGLMLIADILRGHNARFSLSTDPTTSLTTFTITL